MYWLFKSQIQQLQIQMYIAKDLSDKLVAHEAKIKNMLDNIDVSVDVHEYSRSWAVISLQGRKTDYIKFVDLEDSDIKEIGMFLRKFDRRTNVKIDATPIASNFLRIERENRH